MRYCERKRGQERQREVTRERDRDISREKEREEVRGFSSVRGDEIKYLL